MSNVLSYRIEEKNGATKLSLFGEITEEADFKPILEQKLKNLTVDLSEITRINSCGVREWIEFVRACNDGGVTLTLERCAPFIVAQLNMISNFAGASGKVRSVYAPYYCDNCDAEHLELIDLSSDKEEPLEEEVACPSCSSPMEFDDIPETYLQFRTDT